MRLSGKVVLITGAGRRLGRVLARAFAGRGARLAIHYNHSKKAADTLCTDLKDSPGNDAEAFQADLGEISQVQRLAKAVLRRFGTIDVLINNASAYESSKFGKTTRAQWNTHLDVNLRAPFFLSQAVAPAMRKARRGKIINIGDWAAYRPYNDYIPYCVSKAGLACLTTALAKELAPSIQVNAILPGPVLLPEGFSAAARRKVIEAVPLKRIGSPSDIAAAALYLIESGDFVTGAALPVDGGRLIA